MKQSSEDATQQVVAAMRRVDTSLPDIRRERNAQRMRADIAAIAAQFAGRRDTATALRWRQAIRWLVPAALVATALVVWLWPITTPAIPGHAPAVACLTPYRSDNINALPRTKAYLGGRFDHLVTGRDDVLHTNVAGTLIQAVLIDETVLDVHTASADAVELELRSGLLVVENLGPTRLRIDVGTRLIDATHARFAVYREGEASVIVVDYGPVVLSAGVGFAVPVMAGQWPASDDATRMVEQHGLWRWLRALSIQTATVESAMPAAQPAAPVATGVVAASVHEPSTTHRLPTRQAVETSAPTELPAPDSAAELYRAAEAALAAGDSSTATATWQTLIARFPNDERVATALYDLASVARRTADYDDATRWLTRIPTSAPASLRSNAAYLLCRIAIDRSEVATAAACLQAYRQRYVQSAHDQEVLQWLVAYHRNHSECAVTRSLAQEYVRRYRDFEFAAQAQALLTCGVTP